MSEFQDIEDLKPQSIIPSQRDLSDRRKQILILYNNPEVGLSSMKEFMRKLETSGYDYTLKEIKEALRSNNSYTQNQRHTHPKKYNSYEAERPFQILQMDLIFIKEWEEANGGYPVILTAVDTFTRFSFAFFQRTKSAEDTKYSLQLLFNQIYEINQYLKTNNKVLEIVCDRGTEFYNSAVKEYLASQNVLLYSPNSPYKAAIAERFNRTLKQKFISYTTAHQTRKYTDVILSILRNYNNSYHSTIGMTPKQALTDLKHPMLPNYPEPNKQRYNFKVGDFVRVIQDKKPGFSKEIHQENYSIEVFIIKRIEKYQDIVKYYLVDLQDDLLNQTFYNEDIVPVDKHTIEGNFNYYILKDDKRNRRRLLGIVGYDDRKFYKWVPYENSN